MEASAQAAHDSELDALLLVASAPVALSDSDAVVPAVALLPHVGSRAAPMLHETPAGQQPLRHLGEKG